MKAHPIWGAAVIAPILELKASPGYRANNCIRGDYITNSVSADRTV